MAAVYALVKEVSTVKDNGTTCTIHGVTDSEAVSDTWQAAYADNYSVSFDTSDTPDSNAWELEIE